METPRRIPEAELGALLRLLEDLFEEVRLSEEGAEEPVPLAPAVRSRPFRVENREQLVCLELEGTPAAWWDALYRDELTRLYDRRYLRTLLRPARRPPQGLGVVLLDLRGFKRINDQWGHLEGDRLLRQVARTLLAAVRERERAVRWGGDEFLVLMLSCGEKEVAGRMEELRETVCAVTPADFGCAWTGGFRGGQESFLALMDQADRKMYEEKRRSQEECAAP